MRSFVRLAVVGASGVVLLKLITTVFVPALGMIIGLLMLTVKVALIAAIVFFVYSLLRPRRREEEAGTTTREEEELEIVVEQTSEPDGA